MQTRDQLFFQRLWQQYAALAPSAHRIHALFGARGETVENDHIAFRTFNDARINIEALQRPFLKMGYREKGEYEFVEKKLRARHYEHPDPDYPRIFISELKLQEISPASQNIINAFLSKMDSSAVLPDEWILAGRLWPQPSHQVYMQLQQESEYAAWLYVYGFCANHFTVYTNTLQHFSSLQAVNRFLEENGFSLNKSGGEIKGTRAQLLEQSSILADRIEVVFEEGAFTIPGCYYEFARRYKDASGNMYMGFIAASADKIFESTDAALSNLK